MYDITTESSLYDSKKYHRLLSFASEQSFFSPMQHKHGAVIFQGKRLICKGYNTNQRNKYMGNFTCSIHAEIDVLVKFLNSYAKIHIIKANPGKTRRKLKKYSIGVVRMHQTNSDSPVYQNSSPCKDCVKRLQMVGLNKLSFSINDTEICTDKIQRLNVNDYNYSKSLCCVDVRRQLKTVSLLI
jgi:tRNA(Arg) A34 adenosine deaminase TadA